MRIIFIRHGRTLSNTQHKLDTGFPGAPLDEVGSSQAEALVDKLREEPIELIMTSDITRARQTAEPLAKAKGIPVIVHPGVREIFAGDWDMDTEWEPYMNVILAWRDDPTVSMPHGDSGVTFFRRYTAAITELANEGVACAAVVSHGAAMRIWLSATGRVSIDDEKDWALKNTDRVIIEGMPDQWKVISWGDHVVV